METVSLEIQSCHQSLGEIYPPPPPHSCQVNFLKQDNSSQQHPRFFIQIGGGKHAFLQHRTNAESITLTTLHSNITTPLCNARIEAETQAGGRRSRTHHPEVPAAFALKLP